MVAKDKEALVKKSIDLDNDALKEAAAAGGLHNSVRGTIAQPTSKINEKDNLLKYEISDDKEENDLLHDMMNTIKKNEPASSSLLKDGDIISID